MLPAVRQGGLSAAAFLIDVPDDIDVHSPNFKVWVSGADIHGAGDEGSPDPDAIGIITSP